MQEVQVGSLGLEDALGKEMATHSSVLAWETLWSEEAGRLQSIGLQRVQDDSSTKQQLQIWEEATGGNHFLRTRSQTTVSSSSSPMTLRFHSSVNILVHQVCVRQSPF